MDVVRAPPLKPEMRDMTSMVTAAARRRLGVVSSSLRVEERRLASVASSALLPVAAAAMAPPPPLTQQQAEYFHTFGFLVLRGYLRPDEVARCGAEFANGLCRKDHGERMAGVRQQLNWTNLDEHSPFIQSLLEDERFYGVARQLLGECVGFDSNCNFYSGDRSPWHPDVGGELVGLKFTMSAS
eukprot:SAG25_NODE_1721_length_2455_cov_309.615874_1_plen_184_part_00